MRWIALDLLNAAYRKLYSQNILFELSRDTIRIYIIKNGIQHSLILVKNTFHAENAELNIAFSLLEISSSPSIDFLSLLFAKTFKVALNKQWSLNSVLIFYFILLVLYLFFANYNNLLVILMLHITRPKSARLLNHICTSIPTKGYKLPPIWVHNTNYQLICNCTSILI